MFTFGLVKPLMDSSALLTVWCCWSSCRVLSEEGDSTATSLSNSLNAPTPLSTCIGMILLTFSTSVLLLDDLCAGPPLSCLPKMGCSIWGSPKGSSEKYWIIMQNPYLLHIM